MERYINSYATENDIQTALQNGELLKPYVAYIEDVDRIDWNSKSKVDYTTEYLTFNILSAGTINWTAKDSSLTRTIEYKINDGEWTSITSNTGASAPSITVNSGDKIQFKGSNAQYATGYSNYSSFSGSTASFEAEGNIMSLINPTDFFTLTTLQRTYTFLSLFSYCTGLTSAEKLILPATTLANFCYESMFSNCTSLTTAPVLPATTLATSCYGNMFNNCTRLKTAPELPATTLVGYCYTSMFYSCSSLTTAPALPANTLVGGCYSNMFRFCTKLNYIKCLATDISANDCTNAWVQGVASTGTFVKPSSMTSWPTGVNGIPEGWTVQDA